MIAAGHQPNYLPWLGFFDKMFQCDVFIILDDVQYEKQGFTNRNKVKTFQGIKWLTVPVKHVGHPLAVNEVQISNASEPDWAKRHWLTLKQNYCKAPFWEKYAVFFEDIYKKNWTKLFDLNMCLIRGIMRFLNIHTPLVLSSSLGVYAKKSEGALARCKAVGADTLFSGTGAKAYLNLEEFKREGIKVVFQDFQYPIYTQLHGDFAPNLSVVDYLFCTGGKPWLKSTYERSLEN